MPTSRLKPRFPRVKPSDCLDHPDCPDQYADMPLVHVHAGHRFVDKGGRKRPRKADAQSSHTASATSSVNTTTNQPVPVASSSVSTSVFVNDLDFAQGDFDDGQSTGPWEHQDYEYEDQGACKLPSLPLLPPPLKTRHLPITCVRWLRQPRELFWAT